MIFGVNHHSSELLEMLDLTTGDVGRFRDVHLNKDGTKIKVLTRNGGGNREEYEDVFDELSVHPNYIEDYDDSFDCTYATIVFSVPEQHLKQTKEMVNQS